MGLTKNMNQNQIVKEDLDYIHHAISHDGFQDAVIVVTGCAGFLGFYLMHYLVQYSKILGIKSIIGLDNFLVSTPTWLHQLKKDYPDVFLLYEFDITCDDIKAIKGVESATHVIHMASIASPTFYRKYPIETLDANIWGLRHLLNLYQNSKQLRGFLFFSSSEIYGDPTVDAIPTSEEYRGSVACIGPRACYDEAKRFGETMCYLFAHEFNMPITVVRPFNNYGPGMRLTDKRLPADFAQCSIENKDIIIHSDGHPTRTFCYIADAMIGYLKSLLYGKYDYFNIGIDRPEMSVRDLAYIYQTTAYEIFGHDINVHYQKSEDLNYLVDNPNRRCPVIKKARDTLGYDPKILVDEGVLRYLKYLKIERHVA